MKNKIKNEIQKFYFDTSYIPRYSDLNASRYIIRKEFGDLKNAISNSLFFPKSVFSNVRLMTSDFDSIGSSLEKRLEYFVLTELRWPTKKDCTNGLGSYNSYKEYLGSFKKSTIFYDDLRARLNSKRELLGLNRITRFSDLEYIDPIITEEEPNSQLYFYNMLLDRLSEIKLDLINDFKFGSIRVEYGLDWEYKIYKYQKYTEDEYEAVFKEKYSGERFKKTKAITKEW